MDGRTPEFPELTADKRNILTGPRGLIRLVEAGVEDLVESLFDRLVRVLACVSQEIRISEHVSIFRYADENEVLVFIDPSNPGARDLSTQYDMLAGVAVMAGEQIASAPANQAQGIRDEKSHTG